MSFPFKYLQALKVSLHSTPVNVAISFGFSDLKLFFALELESPENTLVVEEEGFWQYPASLARLTDS